LHYFDLKNIFALISPILSEITTHLLIQKINGRFSKW